MMRPYAIVDLSNQRDALAALDEFGKNSENRQTDLATTPLMSSRATLIEHLIDDSIVRLTMIRQETRRSRAVMPGLYPPFAQRSATTMKSVKSRSAIFATE